MSADDLLTAGFRALSARLGQDPLRVQGPGGNTSVKNGEVMWIKASGTELASAETDQIFVAVDRRAARAEAMGDGDGSCKDTVLDPEIGLRPSIETTFHAALEYPVVVHTHSIATLVHAISPEGTAALQDKLSGLPFVVVPYAKPGLPLTREILNRVRAETQIIVLQNHGLIICGESVAEVAELTEQVEHLLKMPVLRGGGGTPEADAPDGFHWSDHGWMAQDPATCALITAGSYYPDHVVFLGPALPVTDHEGTPPALIVPDQGILLCDTATSSQRAMLQCLSDVMSRLLSDWRAEPIGAEAEAALLNWDAEKYRQALAARA
jgi:rhamnose utilization protein RhaD (predicted bifunctional aldolase and dehydrogenase)